MWGGGGGEEDWQFNPLFVLLDIDKSGIRTTFQKWYLSAFDIFRELNQEYSKVLSLFLLMSIYRYFNLNETIIIKVTFIHLLTRSKYLRWNQIFDKTTCEISVIEIVKLQEEYRGTLYKNRSRVVPWGWLGHYLVIIAPRISKVLPISVRNQ